MKKLKHYVMIPGSPWLYLAGLTKNMTDLDKYGIRHSFHAVLVTLNRYNVDYYMYEDDFNTIQQEILQRVINDVNWVFSFNRDLSELNDRYMNQSLVVNSTNFGKLSESELNDLWQELNKLKELTHAKGIITTWLLDEETQPFSQFLLNLIKKKLNGNENKLSEFFSILSSPTENSEVQKEEIELCKLFLSKNDKLTGEDFEDFSKKYGWLNYRFLGPVKSANEYKLQIEEIENPEQKIIDIDRTIEELRESQIKLESELKFNEKEKQFFKLARELVKIKDVRKAGQFLGSYVNDKILLEIARRKSVNLESARQLLPWEIEKILLDQINIDVREMGERNQYSCLFCAEGKTDFYFGQEAKNFIDKLDFEVEDTSETQEIKGMCACPGFSKGIVKIINTVDQLDKINDGDIMVSHATYPDLVPAMKRASAIITEEGGLTCHAAIVSRELKKPCVIGTKIATKVLKDGDMVEVDADKGIVKILEK